MTIAGLSIRRPVAVLMVVLAAVTFGAISLGRLGLDLLPDIDLPVIAVITVYPNADPQTVEDSVTKPIEGSIQTVPNVARVTSLSRENISVVIAEFNWGTNLDAASGDMSSYLDRLSLTLPKETQKPILLRMNPNQLPQMILGVRATDGMNLPALTERVNQSLVPLLERVRGVARVAVSGGTSTAVKVLYKSEDLKKNGISPALLQQIIGYQNVSVPGPALEVDGTRYATRIGREFSSIDDIRDLVIGRKSSESGSAAGAFGLLFPRFLTVGDVASVEEVAVEPEGYTRLNGRTAILLSVMKKSGENTVLLARRIRAALASAKKDLPGIEVAPVLDQADFIERSLSSLAQNGILGGVLAVAILFIFLRDYKSTILIGLAIPLSVIVTFVLMYFGHLTLNIMTLGGLALGVGMLVDNAIVVLENIFRRRELGEGTVESAERGTNEVGMAITASTMTTIAVFLPAVFVGGMAGQLFKELSLTVSFSLLASLFVSLSCVPALAARVRFLEKPKGSESPGTRRAGKLIDTYGRWLSWALDHKRHVLGAVGLALVAAVVIYFFIGIELLAPMEVGEFSVGIICPAGTPAGDTNRVAQDVERSMLAIPEVEVVSTTVGGSGGQDLLSTLMGTTSNRANLNVILKRSGRRRSTASVLDQAKQLAAELEGKHPGARIVVNDSPMEAIGGTLGDFFARNVTIQVRGGDFEQARQIAQRVEEELRKVPGFVDVSSSIEELQPMIVFDVNRTRALLAELLQGQVGMSARGALVGTTVTYLREGGKEIPVIVQPRPEETKDLEAILGLKISSPMAIPGTAGPAPEAEFGRIAKVRKTQGPITLTRENGASIVTVTANLKGISLDAAGSAAKAAIARIDTPPGYKVELAGIHSLIAESFADMRIALVLAVVLVYMVMAIQFESLFHPFIIMFTMPLAAIGAIFSLFITGNNIGVLSLMGMIILAGIVVNNGIVMVDFVNQLIGRGYTLRDALLEGGKARLRPVLMTALTTILGLVPLALGFGEGAELEQPLAITIIGGLTSATFLTLFVIPVIYELLNSRFGWGRDDRGDLRDARERAAQK